MAYATPFIATNINFIKNADKLPNIEKKRASKGDNFIISGMIK